jgi:hypothetical protein
MTKIKSDDLYMPRRNYNLRSAVVPHRAKDPSAEDHVEIQKPGSKTMRVRKGTGLTRHRRSTRTMQGQASDRREHVRQQSAPRRGTRGACMPGVTGGR